MHAQRLILAAGLLLGVQGIPPQAQGQSTPQATGDRSTTVQMRNAEGQSVGTVTVRPLRHGTLFVADLRNLPPGPHGFHLHEHGRCEAPGFQSAGGHYNPNGAEHGFDSARGPHVGDLPNIHVTQQGTAQAEFISSRVSLGGEQAQAGGTGPFPLLDSDGSAIMIHAQADDYRDGDSAGRRIACGVIRAGS
ncbi:superoxide dismutase family protein [Falsiroseomonas selenitidurans]|uniref:Superoxide dismutase family protein n=1 Tax=Falsiroseomonas selenitidurans TaxID=2716335 RepID=A0ABX1E1V8_9PROT|nr:superoxide dismutase family protein [Falsiroseomonas selenitidurans]NKC29742.1 superoxide dismutase family protein [Falsiroseomonas selenitidurans]